MARLALRLLHRALHDTVNIQHRAVHALFAVSDEQAQAAGLLHNAPIEHACQLALLLGLTALDAKRALLLAISHELRSPLTRARLNTELLPESGETEEQRSALLRDLAEMAQLITDLLESERLSGNHAALNLEATDLGQLLQEVADSMNSSLPLNLKIEPDLPLLQLDRTRMKLLLRNLLDNAQRHGQGMDQPIEVSLSRAGDTLELTVRDHGPGVPAEQLPQLGQAFFRSDAARQRSTGGVGLGLYLCRLVAQAHGGELMLENAGPGLRACVRLPV